MASKKQSQLRVKKTTLVGSPKVSGYGITDGKQWFWWAYESKEAAEKMLPDLGAEMASRVNYVCHNRPYRLFYRKPENIESV